MGSLPRSVGYNLTELDHIEMCKFCVGYTADGRGVPEDIMKKNMQMGLRQWIMYVFVVFISSVKIAHEARDWFKNVILLHRTRPNDWLPPASAENIESGDSNISHFHVLLHNHSL